MLDLWIFISWFRRDDVFTKESNIMDRGLFDGGFVYYKHTAVCFTRRSLMDCSHVDYLWIIVMFYQLSFWRHPFTAEDPLVNKWCNATFLQIYVKKSFCMSIKNLYFDLSVRFFRTTTHCVNGKIIKEMNANLKPWTTSKSLKQHNSTERFSKGWDNFIEQQNDNANTCQSVLCLAFFLDGDLNMPFYLRCRFEMKFTAVRVSKAFVGGLLWQKLT